MAQRTGADGLIAPKAKTATARAIALAVAVAALAASGCGGGSGSESASAPPGSQAGGQEATATTGSPQPKSSPSSPAGGKAKAAHEGSDPSSPQGTAKHGAQIKAPKGAPERAPSAAEKAESTLDSIVLQSPDLGPAAAGSEAILPATFTCDGKDTPPSLNWRGVPPGAAELVLFVLGLEPVNEALFFNWAVAGLDPSLQGIEDGKLPPGAILGKNSFGKEAYSICPPKGKPETFIFALYALPTSLEPKRGFDPMALRKEILALAGNVGLMAASYGR